MRRQSLVSITVLATLAATLLAAQTNPPAGQPATSAIVNVNVLSMENDRVTAESTVIVREGRVVSVGPSASTRPPAGATVIEGRGKFLMPGLTEMHGHIPPPTSQPALIDSVLFLYVANGVTTVRGMQGADGQLALRERSRRPDVIAPTLYLAGPGFSGDTVTSPDAAVARVRQQQQQGWDLIKVLGGMDIETYRAMARTAREVQIPFAGHVPEAVGPDRAMTEGQDTIDHLDQFAESIGGEETALSDQTIRTFAARVRGSKTAVVPTLLVWETLRGAITLESRTSFPELRYLPRRQIQDWTNQLANRLKSGGANSQGARHYIENRTRILRALDQAGATILLGSDAPQQFNVPGFSLHREMAEMIEAGMSPYSVLRAGTAAVGDHLVAKDRFGRIAVGQRADFILVDANPMTDVANAVRRAGVMLRGRWIPESEIQARLTAIARANAN